MATTQGRRVPAKARVGFDGKRAEAALERLNASLDAAQVAAKSLRKDVRRGRRDLAKDVEHMIVATRRDTAKLATAVRADVAELQKAVVSPPVASRAKAGPTRARRATPKATRKTPARKA